MTGDTTKYHIFFWDTETTGFFQYANPPAILDLALVDEGGEVAQWLINPGGVHISVKAREIHGIDESKVADCENFGQIAVKMFDFVQSRAGSATPILCGFNSHRFDNYVLLAELARYGLEFPREWLFADLYPHLQQRASRHRVPILLQEQLSEIPNRKLTTIYKALVGSDFPEAHRAAADAMALQVVWKTVRAHHPDFELPAINAECARGNRWGELRVRKAPPADGKLGAKDADDRSSKIPHGTKPVDVNAGASAPAHTAPRAGPNAKPARPEASRPNKVGPVPALLDSESVEQLWGVGPKMGTALRASGVTTVGGLRALFAARLGGSAAALGAHVRDALRVPLSERYVLAIAEQLAAPPPAP